MPIFAFIGRDRPDSAGLRQTHRPAHLVGMEALERDGRIRHAGPLLDEAGAPVGSLILFEADSLAAARELAARDPYVTERVFASYDVHETKVVFPAAS